MFFVMMFDIQCVGNFCKKKRRLFSLLFFLENGRPNGSGVFSSIVCVCCFFVVVVFIAQNPQCPVPLSMGLWLIHSNIPHIFSTTVVLHLKNEEKKRLIFSCIQKKVVPLQK